jgi:heat shock protein HtpX
MLSKKLITWHKIINIIQTIFVLGIMAALFISVGYFIGGTVGIVWALIAGFVLVIITPRMSPSLVLRMYRAIPLNYHDAPALYRISNELSHRAGIAPLPILFYIPSNQTNAFSVGRKHNSAVALTDGLLRRLNGNEITAVLAHEISHISHGDLRIMNLADALSRFTDLFSTVGIFLLLLYFPLYLMMGIVLPLPAILLLMCAPTCSVLLQLALSRTREYNADLGAVELTGDPISLATALKKINHYPVRLFDFLPIPRPRESLPSMLRTHPLTQKRIDRLLRLAETYTPNMIPVPYAFSQNGFAVPSDNNRRLFRRLW